MSNSMKVAISLPAHILKEVEERRLAAGESRSEFFRRAAEKLLQQDREASAVEAYVEGYLASPESTDELAEIHRAGAAVLAEETW